MTRSYLGGTVQWHLRHPRYPEPWGVQVEALRRSAGLERYGYFLEQGLGKSPLSLNDYVDHLKQGDVDLCVVAVPQSFKMDWALLPEQWGVPEINGKMWPRDPIPFKDEACLYAVNYEAISRSKAASQQLRQLFGDRRVMFVVDESAAIKNHSSGFSKAVLDLSKRSAMVRELNGTPMVQNVMDYFMQLKVLGELDGVNPYAFKNRFAVLGGYMGKVVQRDEIRNSDELYSIIDRCSFRALKRDWRDLPPQIDVPVSLEMTNRQLKAYREMYDDLFTTVGDVEVTAELILTQTMRLQQISSCLASSDGRWTFIEEPKDNPKARAVLDVIDGGPGKTIVTHVFRPSGAMLYDLMSDRKLRPARIAGRMEPEELIEEKRRFNEDPDCRVMIAQQSAAFRGHTLIGGEGRDRCARIVHYETSYSYYEYSQIRDRIHRGEQDQDCNYYQLTCSPADRFVYETLAGKRDMADAVDEAITAIQRGDWRL